MRQDPEEPFRTFAAHVEGKAESCEFKTDYHDICSGCQAAFNGNVYHTDEIVRDVLLNGIADVDIRREALSAYSMQKKPINEVIAFIESKETARNANPASGVSAISTYRRNHKPLGENSQRKSKFTPTQTDREKTAKCPDCGKVFNIFTKKARGWNTRPYERCESCWRARRGTQRAEHSSITYTDIDSFGQVSGISRQTQSATLHHQIFSKGEWRRAKVTKHPTVNL